MRRKHWLVLVSFVLASMSSCKTPEREYCLANYRNPGFKDLAACCETYPEYCAVGGPCNSDEDCPSPLLCNTGEEMCVQCTTERHDACTELTPACGDDGVCRGCQAHSECPGSDACLPDGTCADPEAVAYVKPTALGGTDNTECTLSKPCTKVTNALGTNRPYIKIAGTNNEGVTISIDFARAVTLLAEPDAKLIRTSNGAIISVGGQSQVEIYDLELSGASGANGAGISLPAGGNSTIKLDHVKLFNNQGSGILSADGGSIIVTRSTITGNAGGGFSTKNASLTINQSTISGNNLGGILALGGALTISRSAIQGNSGGGISVGMPGTFVVVGNVFFGNGTAAGNVGGIVITTTENAANRVEFNSFSSNQAQNGIGSAIQCIAGTFTARNNIMSNNGNFTNLNQTGGPCGYSYSIARPGVVPSGTENSNLDPLFENETTGNLHLKAGSPALSAAAPDSVLTDLAKFDIDGDERKTRADIGADEVP